MVYIFNIGSPGGNKLNLSSILRPNTAFGPVRVIRFNLDGQVLVTGHDVGALEVFIFIFPHLFFSMSAIGYWNIRLTHIPYSDARCNLNALVHATYYVVFF